MVAHFIDRTDSEQQRYDRARTSRPRAALLRSAGVAATGELDLHAAPDSETARLVGDFGHTMASANILLAEYEDFTEPYRVLVDALIGLAGDRVEWFEANDKLVAAHAGRNEKWVQRTRKEFMAWQKKRATSYVDIADHVYDPHKGNKPHQYRVNIVRIAAEATLDARAAREFKTHPGRTLETSANNLRSMLPTPTHKRRKPERPDDAAKQIRTKLKTIGTLIDRVEEIREATGGQVSIDLGTIEDLEQRLAVLKAAALDPLSTTLKEKVVDINHARRSAAPVHPDLPGNALAQGPGDYQTRMSTFTDEQQDEYEAAFDEARNHAASEGSTASETQAAALRTVGDIVTYFERKGGGAQKSPPPKQL